MADEIDWEARGQQIAKIAIATYPWHLCIFVSVNVLLTALNVWGGPPWWGIWPLLVTGLVFTVHYLIYKAATVDDQWVEDRATDLYDKSYDQGHISNIAGRHGMETPMDRLEREIRERAARRRQASEKPNTEADDT